MSPSAFLGGSFLAGAGSEEDIGKGSVRRHTTHPPTGHYHHDPRPLLPDTTSSWGRRIQCHHRSSSVAIPSHQEGVQGQSGECWGTSKESRKE